MIDRKLIAEARMTLCKECEKYRAKTRTCAPPWQGGCGCFLPAKTLIIRAKCPLGKW